jgi:hypothetical protein
VAREWAYDRLDPDEKIEADGSDAGMLFSVDPGHYLPMCKPCHARFDLRYVA